MIDRSDIALFAWMAAAFFIIVLVSALWDRMNPARWLTSQERVWCAEHSSCKTVDCCRDYFTEQAGRLPSN